MRIVALADTHLFHEDLRIIPDGDVLIHAGDACREGTLDELARALELLRAQPHRHKLFVAGNHDVALEREPAAARALFPPDVIYLEDEGVELEGVRFWGSPWTPRYHEWGFMLERGAALAARWALIPDEVDVLVTHCPPLGFGDRGGTDEHMGSSELLERALAVAPLLHLFGHAHHGRGAFSHRGVTLANVTTWECELPPAVFDLDVSRRRVDVIAI